jgi:hypothetical protein
MVSERDIQSYLSTKTERAAGGIVMTERRARTTARRFTSPHLLFLPPSLYPVAYCRLPC